jgi:hypothetical protein
MKHTGHILSMLGIVHPNFDIISSVSMKTECFEGAAFDFNEEPIGSEEEVMGFKDEAVTFRVNRRSVDIFIKR